MSELDIVQQWLQKSADDLYSAEVLLGVEMLSNSCYFSQQASEKSLKTYLKQFAEEVPHTHNLRLLCKQCMEHDESFDEIFRIASDLTYYATATRYPSDDTIDIDDAEEALQKAGKIFLFVQQRIAQ